MSADIKLNKIQIFKIIQPGGVFCFFLDDLGKKALPISFNLSFPPIIKQCFTGLGRK